MSYETTPIGQWDEDCWQEFYRFLMTKLDMSTTTNWDSGTAEVRVPDGNIMYTFFWYGRRWSKNPTNNVYLDIQPKPFKNPPDKYLNFRVEIKGQDNNASVRNECSRIIKEKSRQMNISGIIAPPPRPALGKTMRFAVVDSRNWLGRDDEIINKARVLENLHVYENLLEECFVGN
jgi:hypothetical protein